MHENKSRQEHICEKLKVMEAVKQLFVLDFVLCDDYVKFSSPVALLLKEEQVGKFDKLLSLKGVT